MMSTDLVGFVLGVEIACFFAHEIISNWVGSSLPSQRAVVGTTNRDVHVQVFASCLVLVSSDVVRAIANLVLIC
jgi:hypothetical protein